MRQPDISNGFWGENDDSQPRLTDEDVRYAELQLGVNLPRSYVALLRRQNGGYTMGLAVQVPLTRGLGADILELSDFNGVVVDPSCRSAFNILKSPVWTSEWDLPERQVLLAGDGHWWLSLDYRDGVQPSVQLLCPGFDEDVIVADTFDAFLEKLMPLRYEDED